MNLNTMYNIFHSVMSSQFCVLFFFNSVLNFMLIVLPFLMTMAFFLLAALVAGYNVEYSGFFFAAFFLMEYSNMLLMSTIFILFFLGGGDFMWMVPLMQSIVLFSKNISIMFDMCFSLKLMCLVFFFVFIRANLPRFSFDQLMFFSVEDMYYDCVGDPTSYDSKGDLKFKGGQLLSDSDIEVLLFEHGWWWVRFYTYEGDKTQDSSTDTVIRMSSNEFSLNEVFKTDLEMGHSIQMLELWVGSPLMSDKFHDWDWHGSEWATWVHSVDDSCMKLTRAQLNKLSLSFNKGK